MTRTQRLPNGLVVRGINRNETEYLYKEIFEDLGYLPPDGVSLPDHPVIIDVGANIGMFTLFAAQRWPTARIFSFEPIPDVFQALSENVADLPNVTAVNRAVGSVAEKRELTFYPHYSMMSGFDADPAEDKELVQSYIRNVAAGLDDAERREVFVEEAEEILSGRFEEIRKVPCEVVRLDETVKSLGIDRIDFLKVDVEGFEIEVLGGIGDELWPNIGVAAVEVEGEGRLAAAIDLMTGHGMRTTVEQPGEYRDTDVFTLFARRPA
ncbi:FkbM family methyltransferase [Micromonospora sp. STR1_7]|uniref:FkbM family methyltransferase n=1 Tax=Micromonospora parastrephiae TaxID=2806101 RepID=A0ABS1XRA6_9ACTN|nr:FkbM family methyltransferase [Micromonospora parastrephiae]MBM0231729.1 FkbM family methyltransferase [Micromonospora parastrephiae]